MDKCKHCCGQVVKDKWGEKVCLQCGRPVVKLTKQEASRKGGLATLLKYGPEHMAEIAKLNYSRKN